ncbi:hypothetical protein AMK16_27460 [Streptomyces sp. CB00455]|nr:hypothetical protein AMK16_27460 [Streptomyces sp. CB00455]
MATPAMADEVQNPAIAMPDAEPKDDGPTTIGAVPQPGEAPVAKGEVPKAGSRQTLQAKPATPDQAAAHGPTMTLTGLPGEFKAGSNWREFSLHVDNSGRPAADDYSLELVLWTLDTFAWKSSDIQAEVYAPDASGTWGWHKIEPDGSEEVYSLRVADVDIEKNEVFALKLRMKFAKDTPVSRFSLSTTAEGGTADRVRYESKVTAADKQADHAGPNIALQGLPRAGFKAGGDWQPFTLSVDNSGKMALDRYGFDVSIQNNESTLRAKHLDIEVWDGKRWTTAEKDRNFGGVFFDRAVAKDAKFDIQLRAKAAQDAPVGKAFVVAKADDAAQTKSNMAFAYTSITAPATEDDGGQSGGSTGNQPKPDGGVTPVAGHGGSSGQLAATGSDPATSWALGAAGAALAMGAALVAGTGKRRRTTT